MTDITEEIKQRIVELYKQGQTRKSIESETGVSQPIIRKVLAEAGFPPRAKKPQSQPAVSAEDFVIAWQQSSSVKEVAQKLNLDPRVVDYRGKYYRRHGVPLKRFPRLRKRQYDWDELAELARRMEKKGDE